MNANAAILPSGFGSVGSHDPDLGVPLSAPPKAMQPPVLPQAVSAEPPALELLVAGMRQLQEATLRSVDSPSKGETVKPGLSTLPTLVEPGPEAPVDFQDWAYSIGPAMQDLSDNSSEWWENILVAAESYYTEFIRLDPVARLNHKPQQNEVLKQARWKRVEKRAETLLLAALPKSVREECVAGRLSGVLSIWCRVMIIYQPGSLLERATALKSLESPGEASDAASAARSLRKWNRWLQRVRSVGGQPPDATILIRALTAVCKKPLEMNVEAGFRIQLARSTLKIDTNLTATKVDELFSLLLAEMENLGHQTYAKSKPVLAQTQVPPVKPPPPPPSSTQPQQAQQSQQTQQPKATAKSKTPCRNFLTNDGCSRGAKCGFAHDTSGLSRAERGKRCFNCGSTTHRVDECKAPKPAPAAPKGKADEPKKPPKVAAVEPKAPTVEPKATPTPQPVNPPANSQPSETSSSSENVKLKAMIAEAHQMLKDLQGSTSGQSNSGGDGRVPRMASLWSDLPKLPELPKLAPCFAQSALLDSGATHPLRQARSAEEKSSAAAVDVVLAGDARSTVLQTSTGTLLADSERAQTIIPLGALISELTLGYLKTSIVEGCPQLAETQALALIAELEQSRLNDFTARLNELEVRLQATENIQPWIVALERFVKGGDRRDLMLAIEGMSFFEALDARALVSMVEGIDLDKGWEYLKSVNLSRAKRKRLFHSDCWFVQWNDAGRGKTYDPLTHLAEFGEVLCLNPQADASFDLEQRKGAFRCLLWAAAKGKIGGIMGSFSKRLWTSACEAENPRRIGLVLQPLLLWTINSLSRSSPTPCAFSVESRAFQNGSIGVDSPTRAWEGFAKLFGMAKVEVDPKVFNSSAPQGQVAIMTTLPLFHLHHLKPSSCSPGHAPKASSDNPEPRVGSGWCLGLRWEVS